MARIQRIKKARASKKPRRCRQCGHEVEIGESYKKIEKKTGPRSSQAIIFCHEHEPRPSHQMSGRSAELAEIQEFCSDEMQQAGDNDERVAALESFGSSIQEFASSILESAEAIESGFEHSTAQSEAMTSTAEEFENWAQEIDSHASAAPDGEGEEYDGDWDEWLTEAEDLVGQEPDLDLQG